MKQVSVHLEYSLPHTPYLTNRLVFMFSLGFIQSGVKFMTRLAYADLVN